MKSKEKGREKEDNQCTLMKGKSDLFAIEAARQVFPVLGAPGIFSGD